MNKLPIGVFDSGIGGLTVLEKLYDLLPHEDYLYLCDNANCPYGVKPKKEVKSIVVNNAKMLEKAGCKMIVIACNTASLFVQDVRNSVKIPVISVIEPTCKYACNASENAKIGVIATNLTIQSKSYQNLILEKSKECFPVACSEFVDYIENNLDDFDKGVSLVNDKLASLKDTNIDTLIYGCTHFSLLEDKIKPLLGELKYIDCGTPTSLLVKATLEEEKLLNDQMLQGVIKVYTTKENSDLISKTKWFKYPYLMMDKRLDKNV